MVDDNPLESVIEDRVCRYARTKGFYVRKFTSPGHRSVPDRMLINPVGHVFFIEFKRRGMPPSTKQEAEHFRLRNYGQHVYIIDNIPLGKRLIDRIVYVRRNTVVALDLEALAQLPASGD